jgi:hypothetical protein
MNEDELLLQDHVRIRTAGTRILIEVRANDKEGSELAVRWSLAATLPMRAAPLHVARARMAVLADYRYFRVCDTCGVRHRAAQVRQVGDGTDICEACDT